MLQIIVNFSNIGVAAATPWHLVLTALTKWINHLKIEVFKMCIRSIKKQVVAEAVLGQRLLLKATISNLYFGTAAQ